MLAQPLGVWCIRSHKVTACLLCSLTSTWNCGVKSSRDIVTNMQKTLSHAFSRPQEGCINTEVLPGGRFGL